MDKDNKDKIYCDDDGKYRIFCQISDKLAKNRYYNNHLKSRTHINNFRMRQLFKNKNISTAFSTTNNALDFGKADSFN